MEWTKDLPKSAGWHWFRDENYSKDKFGLRAPKIVQIVESNSGKLLFADGRLPSEVSQWPGDWAGPINAPQEPPKEGK